jgi:hypothetical protein
MIEEKSESSSMNVSTVDFQLIKDYAGINKAI